MGSVERVTLVFPGQNTLGANVACGFLSEAVGSFAQSGTGGATTTPLVTSAQQAARKFTLAHKSKEPIVAIGIAPDSAVHSCDISLGGDTSDRQKYRISPGNPLLCCLEGGESDFAFVTLPNNFAARTVAAGDIWADASEVLVGSPGTKCAGFPLRLEVFRGEVPIIRSPERAGYHQQGYFDFSAGGAVNKDFFVCLDGRRRVDLIASATTGTLTAFSLEALKAGSGGDGRFDVYGETPLPLDSAGSLSAFLTAGPTAPSIFSFFGNPISVMRVNIACTAADLSQIKIKAYDS